MAVVFPKGPDSMVIRKLPNPERLEKKEVMGVVTPDMIDIGSIIEFRHVVSKKTHYGLVVLKGREFVVSYRIQSGFHLISGIDETRINLKQFMEDSYVNIFTSSMSCKISDVIRVIGKISDHEYASIIACIANVMMGWYHTDATKRFKIQPPMIDPAKLIIGAMTPCHRDVEKQVQPIHPVLPKKQEPVEQVPSEKQEPVQQKSTAWMSKYDADTLLRIDEIFNRFSSNVVDGELIIGRVYDELFHGLVRRSKPRSDSIKISKEKFAEIVTDRIEKSVTNGYARSFVYRVKAIFSGSINRHIDITKDEIEFVLDTISKYDSYREFSRAPEVIKFYSKIGVDNLVTIASRVRKIVNSKIDPDLTQIDSAFSMLSISFAQKQEIRHFIEKAIDENLFSLYFNGDIAIDTMKPKLKLATLFTMGSILKTRTFWYEILEYPANKDVIGYVNSRSTLYDVFAKNQNTKRVVMCIQLISWMIGLSSDDLDEIVNARNTKQLKVVMNPLLHFVNQMPFTNDIIHMIATYTSHTDNEIRDCI